MAVSAGLIADLAQIDLQHLDACRPQWWQAVFGEQLREGRARSALIKNLTLAGRIAERAALSQES